MKALQQQEKTRMDSTFQTLVIKNKTSFLESELELTELIKKNGQITLAPKLDKPDQLRAKVKAGRAFIIRIDIKAIKTANITLKVELHSELQIKLSIQHTSSMLQKAGAIGEPSPKHKLKIPFTLYLSTERDSLYPFKADVFKSCVNSDSVIYDASRASPDATHLYAKLKVKKDCVASFHASIDSQLLTQKTLRLKKQKFNITQKLTSNKHRSSSCDEE